MSKIAILCICTGPYSAFWDVFFSSFERYFLPSSEKHYFIFSDDKKLFELKNERIHVSDLDPEPWPLATLLKYHHFLTVERELKEYDYIYQTNVNMECIGQVEEKEFLPQEIDKPLLFTQHFGYCNKKKCYYPYDRNKKSLAYIPYNCGNIYVYGAMNGGRTEEYIRFMRELDNKILEDLAHGVIAKWHDESHVNHYVASHKDYKILPSDYCYPEGQDMPRDTRIMAIDKKNFFDVSAFKNGGEETQNKITLLYRIRCKLGPMSKTFLTNMMYCRDCVLGRKIID